MKVILASSSPRRQQLLAKICANFEICASTVDETSTEADPQKLVAELSQQKALAAKQGNFDNIVVGSDTVVSFQGEIFGKPQNAEQAFGMLSRLSNATHEVFTGVTLLHMGKPCTFVETTTVRFRKLSPDEINAYIASGNCFDKAGSYGIQETDFVCDIVGSYYNIMGLPLESLQTYLAKFGVNCKQI